MKEVKSSADYSHFIPQKLLLYFRGILMLVIGGLISVGSIFAPDVYMMSSDNGWLPLTAYVLIAIGILESFDTYISRRTHRFIVNLQFAVMDCVFGSIILLSLDSDPGKLSLMISAFLMVKGIFRLIAAVAGNFPHAKTTVIGGLISVVLGGLLLFEWTPTSSIGFISFCLSLEIALRGWSLISFAHWLGQEEHADRESNQT